MKRKLTYKDHIYLAIPFIMMFLLYWSSSMSYETQSLKSPLQDLLSGEPLKNFLSQFEFTYGGSVVSVTESGYFSFVEFFIRKAAHFFSFFIIGFFWVLGLRKRVNEMWLVIVLSILLSIGYACFDEFRQVFHPGRSGMMADVILDSAGACVGITLAYIVDFKKWMK